ncbi:MAG: VWA domain-containing protein [Candidatus Alcyoniella australis]|nr:VWA domain-containing protein [Candidatus Alcyoniella australis]
MKKAVAIFILISMALWIGACTKTGTLVEQQQNVAELPPPVAGESKVLSRAEAADGLRYYQPEFNTETYDRIVENSFKMVGQNPLSTFSIDVDTASYSNVRRFLTQGTQPPPDAVRIEELINYFSYDYPQPAGDDPFSVNVEVAQCPWNLEHRLVRIGLRGRTIEQKERPASNLVFLLDVSGSMNSPNKLPLLKRSFNVLVNQLDKRDSVAIVVYAGASGLVLPSTSCGDKNAIIDAFERLQAGGSTNGGAGIELAYQVAQQNFIKGGNNRVILATDGDFNIGTTNQGDLTRLIEEKAQSGVFLTVLGFGMGNYKDSTLEKLADMGNGNYAYIDNFREARKVFAEQISGTLYTIAKDVKIQVEFNPINVLAYRLVGYENRVLNNEDFNDDQKDAGEIGAGHTVTALYEVVPVGAKLGFEIPDVNELKYQQPTPLTTAAIGPEMLTVALRYKQPDGDTSKLLSMPVIDRGQNFDNASDDFRFAAAVAQFGMLLRGSEFKGGSSYEYLIEVANETKGQDSHGYRAEFIELARLARDIK